MKKITYVLSLLSVILLASCSGGETSSSQTEAQTNWSTADLAVISRVIGENNTLPFFPDFVELNYEPAYVDYSCNYAVIKADKVEDEEQFNTYVDICLEEGFFKDEEATLDYRFGTLMCKEVSNNVTQYVLYYDDDIYCYIETYIISLYEANSFPTSPSIESLINVSWTTIPSCDILTATYHKYVADYNDKVDMIAIIESDGVINEYFNLLTNSNYVLDFDRTTATEYCFYTIREYEEDGAFYADAVEIYFSKQATDDQVNFTFTSIVGTPLD